MDDLSAGAAILWWIGVAALLLVVIPLVLVLAQQVLARLREIDGYATDILDHGVQVTENLDPVPALLDTRDLAASAATKLGHYVGAVDRLLQGGRP